MTKTGSFHICATSPARHMTAKSNCPNVRNGKFVNRPKTGYADGVIGEFIEVNKSSVWVIVAVVAAFLGAYLSWSLLKKHTHSGDVPDFLSSLCEGGGESSISCDRVLSSPWGVIPPIREGDPPDTIRVPAAGVGLTYFTFLLIWYLGVGRASYTARKWHLLPLGVTTLGLFGSIGFVYLMAFELDAWCPLCVASHVSNGLLFIAGLFLWPRRPAGVNRSAADDSTPLPEVDLPRHPTLRLALAVSGLAIFVIGALNQGTDIRRLSIENKRLRAELTDVRDSTETLVMLYQNEERRDIAIRADDPIRFDGQGKPTLVVWSDFECKHCRKFAEDFESKFYKEFDDFIRVVFKHYPLSPECNPYSKIKLHPHACFTAKLAEAVRMQGGNEMFWTLHDELFRAQAQLGQIDPRATAATLGLDPDRLLADMESEIVAKRIAEDIELGKTVGVSATPAVYLDGRKVGNLARHVPAFWAAVGQSVRSFKMKRQLNEQIQQQTNSATPDSPGQQDAR